MTESTEIAAIDPELPEIALDRPGTLLFENDRVRVWELVMKPGDICRWHIHDYDHLLMVIEGASIRGTMSTGEIVELDIDDREVLYMKRSLTPEIAENTSKEKTLRELIIDLKGGPGAATEMSGFRFFDEGTETTAFQKGRPQKD